MILPPRLSLAALLVFAALSFLACTKTSSSEPAGGVGEPSAQGGSPEDGEVDGTGDDSDARGGGTSIPEEPELCATIAEWSDCLGFDFSETDIAADPHWAISTWGNDNRTHTRDNVWVEEGLLHLKVNGGTTPGEQTTGAEIVSSRTDYLYGSFRVVARGTSEPGTVFGWFYYLNDTSEIDIEILSEFDAKQTVHFTIHENIGPQTHQALDVGFSPSADFHEYRFDWFEDRVEYFIDGESIVTLTENVPHEPGSILLNHWTLSNPAWGGGPPAGDAIVKIRSLEIYTND